MDNFLPSSTTSSTHSSKLYGPKSISVNHELRQEIIDSKWEKYALDWNLWKDSKSPVTQVRWNEIDNREYCGILSNRLIGLPSSFLMRSSKNSLYILDKFVVRNKHGRK
ncbi:PREDICTED: uncharacterized protein LOC106745441 [Dinoponera quadriceps]|uniref:Uncharacterized protein LOC106745441 n=1 Tax=Dinoponera quadriceps TaxID=609295 RepID=A0A6P3XED6_DINQU|nr:PREDICTED: uncharacterized protein LOC106745441 [Dinoponera quadriceps]